MTPTSEHSFAVHTVAVGGAVAVAVAVAVAAAVAAGGTVAAAVHPSLEHM